LSAALDSDSAPGPQAEKESSEVEKLEEVLKKKDHEVAELKDLYRRALADAENVRHRTQKEIKGSKICKGIAQHCGYSVNGT
jgi:molecular chaperone GrpE (heat shock protein)